MLAPRVLELLGLERGQRPADPTTRAVRHDHVVDEAAIGRHERIGELLAIFLGALALALAVVFLLYSDHRGLLIPAGILAIVAIADVVGLHLPDAMQPFFVPVVLIAVGLYMLAER